MKYKRCIILLADGSKPDVFRDLLARGELPSIKEHLVDNGSFKTAVSVFPSTTGPAHIPYLTGCLPATCNIPGIRWFDKKKYARYGHGSIFSMGTHGRYRSYVGPETFLINSDMRNDIYTSFEILPKSYSIFNSINRGVGNRNLTKIMRIWYWYYGHLTDRWRFVDDAALKKTVKAVDKGLDFLFTVIPGIDEYSHLASPTHEYAIGQYRALDSGVGELVKKLKKKGQWEDTMLWIVSDHGLSETHSHFCVNTFLESRGIKTFYFPLTYRKGCVAANMVSGNGMTNLYFKKRVIASGAKQSPESIGDWSEPATLEDINEMYPRLLSELLAEPAVDVLAVKDRAGNLVAMTRRGVAKIKMEDGMIDYNVEGNDPFGYTFGSKQFSSDACLSLTFDSDYPDASYQLAHIFSSPRCGDVIVSATPGFDLRVKYENPEHRSSHGSLHRKHMHVPIISNIRLPDGPIRTIDIFPTYLKLMGHDVPGNIDGKALL